MSAFAARSHPKHILSAISDYYLLAYINKKFVSWEIELFTTKWFDYRHLSPLHATIHYMRAYEKTFKRLYAAHLNYEVADYIRLTNIQMLAQNMALPQLNRLENRSPTTSEFKAEQKRVNARKSFTAYWRGRQIADALGMPYDVYTDLVVTKRLRLWGRNLCLPRPAQLYRDIEVEYAQTVWEELQASRLYLAEHPAYSNQNFQNLPQQNDYHEWLFKQAELRSDPPRFLARFVHEDRLPLEKVENRLIGKDYRLRRFRDNLRNFQTETD